MGEEEAGKMYGRYLGKINARRIRRRRKSMQKGRDRWRRNAA